MTIAASDSPGGVFSLSPTAITLSEETASTDTITVQRTGGTLTQVTIEWEALYTDGQIHDTAINSILGVDRATLTFPVGVTSVDITLTLQPNSVSTSKSTFPLYKLCSYFSYSIHLILLCVVWYSGASQWRGLHTTYSIRRHWHQVWSRHRGNCHSTGQTVFSLPNHSF